MRYRAVLSDYQPACLQAAGFDRNVFKFDLPDWLAKDEDGQPIRCFCYLSCCPCSNSRRQCVWLHYAAVLLQGSHACDHRPGGCGLGALGGNGRPDSKPPDLHAEQPSRSAVVSETGLHCVWWCQLLLLRYDGSMQAYSCCDQLHSCCFLHAATACAITTDILQLVGLKSFRVAGVMLVGLLLYDVFWVFGSPSAIGDNVSKPNSGTSSLHYGIIFCLHNRTRYIPGC